MSYLVFARKYRPQQFDEVVGQDHVTRTIRNALKRDRISSGYLFTGPRGTGKTTVARLLAKAVNCVNGPTDEPCGQCAACVEIAGGSSLDVLEIDAASNTGVDDIRTLRENVRYLPASGKKRIYIIDEVHRLSGSAFDALLKTLEEPPGHVIFVMATTDPLKVPETILSRTQRFDFRRVGHDDLSGNMQRICANEGIEIEPQALALLARKADGSVRDSLSLLDQIAAFAGDKITQEDVVNALGLVDRRFLYDFVDAVAESDRNRVLLLVKDLFDGGVEIKDFVLELMDHLRSLMILRSAPQASGLVNLAGDELETLNRQAERFPIGDILRLMQIVSDVYSDLRSGLDERLLLETAAVKMAHLESTVRFEEVLARLKSGEFLSSGSAPASGAGDPGFFAERHGADRATGVPVSKPSDPAPPPQAPPANTPVTLPGLQAGWSGFAARLRRSSPMLASQLGVARLKSVHDNKLTLLFAANAEASMQLANKPDNLRLIQQVLKEHFHAALDVELALDRTLKADNPGRQQKKVDPTELVRNSARLRSILDRVDGEIIGVKQLRKGK